MCRNIKLLFNFDPPATEEEIKNASLQFVRKISGFQKPSEINKKAFDAAVDELTRTTTKLLHSLSTNAQPRNREREAERNRLRNRQRFSH